MHLKELAVFGCCDVTDAGISMVICHCSQLPILNLKVLTYITGMCALCEDPKPTFVFYNPMMYGILSAGSSLPTKAHNWTIL